MPRGLFAHAAVMICGALALAQRPADVNRYRVAELSNRAADLIDQKKYAQAELLLEQGLAIDPNDITTLYDLTCAIAGEGDASRALATLERANRAGFSDFSRVNRESSLAGMRGLLRYKRDFEPAENAVHRAAAFHVRQLESDLGAEYTVVADESNRLIYAVRERTAHVAEVCGSMTSLMAHECDLLFDNHPQQFVRIIVASQADYARLESRTEVRGSYDDMTRTVLVKDAVAELRHEFTHALHAADQHARGQQHPVWLIEGLGVAFENGDATADNWRLANVQAATRSNTLIPLDKLIAQSRSAFNQRSDLAYGEAGSLIVYLDDKGWLEHFYKSYVQKAAADPTARNTLEAVSGMSISNLEADWREWLTHRVAPLGLNH